MKNGIGYYVVIVGCVFFCLMFHCKLHTIKDSSSRNPLRIYSFDSLVGFFMLICYVIIRFVYLNMLGIHEKENMIIDDHTFYLFNIAIFCIMLPKYYVNQNPSLKLYVSVYHHQPGPVLPWQLPNNFDQNNVKLLVAHWQNE